MILAYHRVNPYYKDDVLTVSPENFKRQIEYLLKKGLKFVSSQEYIPHTYLLPKEARGKRKEILITFDDGYADNLCYAIPILERFNIKPLIFLTVNYIGSSNIFSRYKDKEKDRLLNWQEVQEMSEQGIIFGSHSLSHPHLSLLDDKKLWEEVSLSKKIIEDKTGKKILYFCYPYGDFSERVIEKVKLAGYKNAFVTPPKGKKIKENDYTLLRTGIYG
ncbi:MAG: polysaccharide deacetylase family protein, partial [Candidatus Omnitrophica bacterium]|nr:polysaccharide deacetylase family protein [Candidatus Omnitrophota bacterium]